MSFAVLLQHDLQTFHSLHEVQVVYDIETGRSRGFGFVKFDDPRDAEDAINDADGKVGYCFLSNMHGSLQAWTCCSFQSVLMML